MKHPKAFVGRKNSGPTQAYIAIGGAMDGDWMTPAQARRLAKQLVAAADLDSPAWRVEQLARQKAAMGKRRPSAA